MAKATNRLSARTAITLKTPGLHADGAGLYLSVKKTGVRNWVFIFNFAKRRKEMWLGSADKLSLAAARQLRDDARHKITQGVNPIEARSVDRAIVTFGSVATDLIDAMRPTWKNAKHGQQWTNTLTQHAPSIWKAAIDAITTEDVLKVLAPIWGMIPETAARVRARMERVMDAAKVRGLRTGDNPARWKGHLEILLPKRDISKRKHHPAMPYDQLPAFLTELRDRPAKSARALEFLILTAARTSEVLDAEWEEFDVAQKLWIVPGERMKMKREHRVPLTDRAIAILEHVRFLGGHMPFKMSNMGMDMLLRRMDHDDYTVHGFRSSFRDWVGEETEFPREIAEAALAHQIENAVERAYRRGDALNKRRELMEAWEAYITQPSAPPETAQDQ